VTSIDDVRGSASTARTLVDTAPAPVRIARKRLLDKVADAPEHVTVVVVSGPAGSGKSALADQLLDADPRPRAVVALARHHDEPMALATRLLDAYRELGAPTARLRLAVAAEEPTYSATLIPSLEHVAADLPPHVLVVDDLHLVRDPRCHDLLRALAGAVPAGSRLVLLTRDEAPPWLARLRAEGRLLDVEPAELAFDVAETERLFRMLHLHPDRAEVARLVELAEGWAVGLYLTALAMARGVAPTDRISAVPHGPSARIGDYLRSEVLDQLGPDERDFLVRTSVLDELTPGACDALLERTDSARVLEDLHRHNLLVVRLGDGMRFRYHHLLAEELTAELASQDPVGLAALHGRAARWFAAQGDLDDAVRHAKQAGDPALVGELVWSGIEGCLGSGRPDRLRSWLSGLSERDIAADPWLMLAAAWSAEQTGDVDRMRRWLLAAERHAGRDWRDRMRVDEYAASVAILVGVVGESGLDDSIELCRGALDGLPADSGFRAAAAFISGVSLTLRRRPVEATASLVEAEQLARALHVPLVQADALAWQGLMAVAASDTARGADLISQASALIELYRLDRMITSAHCLTAQALLQAMRRSPEAAATLTRARRLTVTIQGVGPWLAVCGPLFQARAALLLGDAALARVLIVEARAAMTPELADSLAQDLLDDTESLYRSAAQAALTGAALTAAEMRVLQFMPSHLSFRLIGEHLHLSLNTVKTHAVSIYRKLGVNSRDEAVERAQELGLVDAPTRD
jgi:LuxR family maltose regulon positive regulatory protein